MSLFWVANSGCRWLVEEPLFRPYFSVARAVLRLDVDRIPERAHERHLSVVFGLDCPRRTPVEIAASE